MSERLHVSRCSLCWHRYRESQGAGERSKGPEQATLSQASGRQEVGDQPLKQSSCVHKLLGAFGGQSCVTRG